MPVESLFLSFTFIYVLEETHTNIYTQSSGSHFKSSHYNLHRDLSDRTLEVIGGSFL